MASGLIRSARHALATQRRGACAPGLIEGAGVRRDAEYAALLSGLARWRSA